MFEKKVTKKEFDEFKKIALGLQPNAYCYCDLETSRRLNNLFEKFEALEKLLGIEYEVETTINEFKGYKMLKSKRGRPKGSKNK